MAKLTEEVPLRKVEYSLKPDQDVECESVPADQVTGTTKYNDMEPGGVERCASHGQNGPTGGSGTAVYTYSRTTGTSEFELKTECDAAIPPGGNCFAALSGPDANGPVLMFDGKSADKSEPGWLLISGVVSALVDKENQTVDLTLMSSRNLVNLTDGTHSERDGKAQSSNVIGAAKWRLAVSFVAKNVEGFGLSNDAELECTKME